MGDWAVRSLSRCMEFSYESLSSADERGLGREPVESFRIRCSQEVKNETDRFSARRKTKMLCHGGLRGCNLDLKRILV